jgi:hypothetical protein
MFELKKKKNVFFCDEKKLQNIEEILIFVAITDHSLVLFRKQTSIECYSEYVTEELLKSSIRCDISKIAPAINSETLRSN